MKYQCATNLSKHTYWLLLAFYAFGHQTLHITLHVQAESSFTDMSPQFSNVVVNNEWVTVKCTQGGGMEMCCVCVSPPPITLKKGAICLEQPTNNRGGLMVHSQHTICTKLHHKHDGKLIVCHFWQRSKSSFTFRAQAKLHQPVQQVAVNSFS